MMILALSRDREMVMRTMKGQLIKSRRVVVVSQRVRQMRR